MLRTIRTLHAGFLAAGFALIVASWTSIRADPMEDARTLVRVLASVAGVSGREGPVRAAISFPAVRALSARPECALGEYCRLRSPVGESIAR